MADSNTLTPVGALVPGALAELVPYEQFIRDKTAVAPSTGFDLPDAEIHPALSGRFAFQRPIVRWCAAGGWRAIFAAFGMGKTMLQAELARQVARRTGRQVLIVGPLGVRGEFMHDAAPRLGLTIPYVTSDAEALAAAEAGHLVVFTNYERVRDGHLSPAYLATLGGVCLDEASVLRSFGSKTYQTFTELFAAVPFKFVATATPSPNRYKELIHYAGFLGVMDTGQALTRFFQRDSEQAGHLTLMPHMEEAFWRWLASWAVVVDRPSDLRDADGEPFSDDGYDLPGLTVTWHCVPTAGDGDPTADNWGQGQLFRNAAAGVRHAAREKRETLPARLAAAQALIAAEPEEHWLLWHHLEAERHAIERAWAPEVAAGTAATVYGTQDLERREQHIRDFAEGRLARLATKPEIAGSGTNLQRHCARAVFLGVDYSFNDLIQSIHRIHRFQQARPVVVHILYADTEVEIVRALKAKWAEHDAMRVTMRTLMQSYGLSDLGGSSALARTADVDRREERGERFVAVHNDAVLELRQMAADSVDLLCTSIPFGNQYEYTPSLHDFGYSEDNGQFFRQFAYLLPEWLRVLKPGRVAAVHVKDRIRFARVTGLAAPTIDRFSDQTADAMERAGFVFFGRITIVTDVVRENNQTYRLGWTEMTKDGTKMGVGMPEYVLLFRKLPTDRSNGYADEPVRHDKAAYTRARWQVDAHGYWRSSGDRMLRPDEIAELPLEAAKRWWEAYSRSHVYDYAAHVALGRDLEAVGRLPATFMLLAPSSWTEEVWTDITRMRTLNGEQARRQVEQHVCLARGSLVLTRDGYVPIEAVPVGAEVLTHEGRWRRVQVVRNMGVRPVVRLAAQGVPHLILTPEHEIWTRRSEWARARDGAERAEPAWVRADATVGGYVNLKLPPERRHPLTAQECWLLGRWLADGHVGTRGDYYVSVGADKLAAFEAAAGEHAGTRAERTATQVRLRRLPPSLLALLAQCGRGAGGKQLPVAALEMPDDQARAVLDGYLSGDGHCVPGRDRWMATSVSRALLLGMAMLAQRAYGAVACIRAGRPAGTAIIEGRTVETQQEWVLSFDLPRAGRRNRPFLLDDGAWRRVRAADPAGEAETWCLRVEGDASFTAEGCVVKNCPFPLDIPRRLVERFTNPGDLVLDPFGGLGSTAHEAIKLGRRGYVVELNPSYWWQSVGYCRTAEAEATAPTLFDALGGDAAVDTQPEAAPLPNAA